MKPVLKPRNPIARVVRTLRPQVKPSGKCYKRRPRTQRRS
jgi:hypothetical protein